MATTIYAKCDEVDRLALWEDVYSLYHNINVPWMVGGDFNVIMNEEDKINELPVCPNKYEEFAFCINSCELMEINFKGSPFT